MPSSNFGPAGGCVRHGYDIPCPGCATEDERAMDSEREKFEAWARPQVRFRGSMTRAANGPYVWDDVEDAWKVWQAANAARATPPVAPNRYRWDTDLDVMIGPVPDGEWVKWSEVATPPDDGCICRGNWRAIVAETEHLIDRKFRSYDGKVLSYFGPVHGEYDYYYGMWSAEGGLRLLSCVGSIDGHGYTLIEESTMLNGLTEAETSATASVAGLTKPPQVSPYGWVTMWPQIGGGTKPVFWPGPTRPSYGEELDATLTVIAVYTRGAPQGLDAALANAGKVIDPLRNAAEQFLASVSDGRAVDLIDYYAEIFEEALKPGTPIGYVSRAAIRNMHLGIQQSAAIVPQSEAADDDDDVPVYFANGVKDTK